MISHWAYNVFYPKFSKEFRKRFTYEHCARSVLIFLGNTYCAIYCFKNSITFFVVGRCKNLASGQSEKWSIDTNMYFFPVFAFWKGPAKSIAISEFCCFTSGSFPIRFVLKYILSSYRIPGTVRIGELDQSMISRCIRGHQMSSIIANIELRPGWP